MWVPDYGLKRLRASAARSGYNLLRDRRNMDFFLLCSVEDGEILLRSKDLKEIQRLVNDLEVLTT